MNNRLQNAIDAFSSLPGIGGKTAFKMVLHLLRQGHDQTERFINALKEMNDGISYCTVCHNISDDTICEICANPSRDHATICVVESIKEQMLIEQTGGFQGVYHVLGGLISPMAGISPSNLQIESLIDRVANGKDSIKEVILALAPNVEGETTSFYLYRKLAGYNVRITTLAQGIAVGDDLEYADEVTLTRALENRRAYNNS